MTRTIRPLGDLALLVELDGLDEVHALHRAATTAGLDGVVDLVPGARTLTVHVRDPGSLGAARAAVASLDLDASGSKSSEEVVIDVVYDGPDLGEVADQLGLSVASLVTRHTDEQWRVAFAGFAPGFAYLAATRHTWDVPRLATPRRSVPAGSVALAGSWAGVYPRSSPGGWQLLGTTDAPLFDIDRDQPALLTVGTTVTFREVDP